MKVDLTERSSFTDQQSLIQRAVEDGISRYIESRKARVPAFVSQHFSIRGALRLHKKTLGQDLYKVPLNILWSVPAIALKALSSILRRSVGQKLAVKLDKMPNGFQTEAQKEVTWLIYTDLLEIPYIQGDRRSEKDALLVAILSNKALSDHLVDYLSAIQTQSKNPDFRKVLEKNLEEYATSRMAASELASSLLTLSAGYSAFHKVLPGTLAVGIETTAAIAQHLAISNFWLGATLGGWYYSVFPATASTGLLVATTGTLVAALAVVATFAGIITDPLQAKLGIHEKRLLRFIDALSAELQGTGNSQFKIKDQYIARIFDILDLLTTAARAAKLT